MPQTTKAGRILHGEERLREVLLVVATDGHDHSLSTEHAGQFETCRHPMCVLARTALGREEPANA